MSDVSKLLSGVRRRKGLADEGEINLHIALKGDALV